MKSVAVVVLMFLLVQGAFSCMLAGKSLSNFDDLEYIFIGTVIGYTKPVPFNERKANNSVEPLSLTLIDESSKSPSTTTGLIVKVNDSVYLPKNGSEFEVYLFNLRADCSIAGIGRNALEFRFPINAEIRVVAKEAIFLTGPQLEQVRLEVRPGEARQLTLNSDRYSNKLTSATSNFDYKAYVFDVNKSESYSLLPDFEIRKELLRLKRATQQSARNQILDRLFDLPINASLDLREVFNLYAGTDADAKRYYETYLKSSDPESYQAYKLWEQVVTDLSGFGYQRAAIERAMKTAFEEGAYLKDKTFLQKCKEILFRDKKNRK